MYLGEYSRSFVPPGIAYHFREPGAIWCLQVILCFINCDPSDIASTINRGFGWFSPVFGALYLCFTYFLARTEVSSTMQRFVFWGISCAGIYMWTFPGHIEFYAPLIASMAFLCYMGKLITDNRISRHWFWVAWAICCTMHRVSLFVLPAFYFLLPVAEGRFRKPDRSDVKAAIAAILALSIPHIAISLMFVYSIPIPFTSRVIIPIEVYNWFPELLTPLTQAQADYVRANSQIGSFHLFTLGSVEHWKHFLFFVLTSAPIGIFGLIACGFSGKLSLRNDFQKFLSTATLFGWLWAFVWHPHMGYADWDLFCWPGIFTNVLFASLVFENQTKEKCPACTGHFRILNLGSDSRKINNFCEADGHDRADASPSPNF